MPKSSYSSIIEQFATKLIADCIITDEIVHEPIMDNLVFRKVKFYGTNFYESSLIGAVFDGCEFFHTYFYSCNMEKSQFTDCDFHQCVFHSTQLDHSSIVNSTVAKLGFEHCGMRDLTVESLSVSDSSDIALYMCILNAPQWVWWSLQYPQSRGFNLSLV